MIRQIVQVFILVACCAASAVASAGVSSIGHIIVIYLENHSFDNLYGLFPGADGIAQAAPENVLQEDAGGKVYRYLPVTDQRFPADLPNAPFDIGRFVPPNQRIPDLVHRFEENQRQINGGKMNRFVAYSNSKGLVMGYYDGRELPLWDYARRYTLADHFFQAAFGGSYLNHQWLICACTPRFQRPPARLIADGSVSADGYAINTVQPAIAPHGAATPKGHLLPPLELPNIGDRLTDAGVDWAWYAGGWNEAVAGHPAANFQFHHQPFGYYRRYARTAEGRSHLKDEADFVRAIDDGSLPPVAFYKPISDLDEHPGYADLLSGEKHIAELLQRIERSSVFKDAVVIVTYDENGGFWDHVAPPKGDRWGPGPRVPALIVSPFARKGHVDHTVYDTTAILKLIERRYGLAPLGERDAKANDLMQALA
ncbi:MAG: acid phosphatase, partial [Methylococcaceae bacterium]|nr:acid phosphatase [Methylococcaceae bacterium]